MTLLLTVMLLAAAPNVAGVNSDAANSDAAKSEAAMSDAVKSDAVKSDAASGETSAAPADAKNSTVPAKSVEPTILPRPEDGRAPWLIRGSRIAVESVVGAGLGAALTVGCGYVGVLIDSAGGRDSGPALQVGAALGATFGVATGVWFGGQLLGGDGLLGWTLLGSSLGTGISALVLAGGSSTFKLVVAALLPIIGAVTGYELSSHLKRPPPEKISLTPVFTGNGLGVAGSF